LERELIRLLQTNGYEYLAITHNDNLLQNCRVQLAKLNAFEFSDAGWQQMVTHYLINKNEGIDEKSTKVQDDYIFNLKPDNGSTKNIRIPDKANVHNNSV